MTPTLPGMPIDRSPQFRPPVAATITLTVSATMLHRNKHRRGSGVSRLQTPEIACVRPATAAAHRRAGPGPGIRGSRTGCRHASGTRLQPQRQHRLRRQGSRTPDRRHRDRAPRNRRSTRMRLAQAAQPGAEPRQRRRSMPSMRALRALARQPSSGPPSPPAEIDDARIGPRQRRCASAAQASGPEDTRARCCSALLRKIRNTTAASASHSSAAAPVSAPQASGRNTIWIGIHQRGSPKRRPRAAASRFPARTAIPRHRPADDRTAGSGRPAAPRPQTAPAAGQARRAGPAVARCCDSLASPGAPAPGPGGSGGTIEGWPAGGRPAAAPAAQAVRVRAAVVWWQAVWPVWRAQVTRAARRRLVVGGGRRPEDQGRLVLGPCRHRRRAIRIDGFPGRTPAPLADLDRFADVGAHAVPGILVHDHDRDAAAVGRIEREPGMNGTLSASPITRRDLLFTEAGTDQFAAGGVGAIGRQPQFE